MTGDVKQGEKHPSAFRTGMEVNVIAADLVDREVFEIEADVTVIVWKGKHRIMDDPGAGKLASDGAHLLTEHETFEILPTPLLTPTGDARPGHKHQRTHEHGDHSIENLPVAHIRDQHHHGPDQQQRDEWNGRFLCRPGNDQAGGQVQQGDGDDPPRRHVGVHLLHDES